MRKKQQVILRDSSYLQLDEKDQFKHYSYFYSWMLSCCVLGLLLAFSPRLLAQADVDTASEVSKPVSVKQQADGLAVKLGVEKLGKGRYRVGIVEFDVNTKVITIPAKVNMQTGFVEYVLVHTQGKIHESVFVTDAKAADVHVAMLLLGAKNKETKSTAAALELKLQWKDVNGFVKNRRLLEVLDLASGDPRESGDLVLPENTWRYSGDILERRNAAHLRYDGSLIALLKDQQALVNNIWLKQQENQMSGQASSSGGKPVRNENAYGVQSAKQGLLPGKGTPVLITLELYAPALPL